MFDPVSLGIMGVSTGLGFLGSKAKEKEARRIEKMNSELSALDSQFAPFVKTAAIKQAQPEAGPGGFAGALQGGLSGFNQAQLIGAKDIYSDLLKGVKPLETTMNKGLTNLAARSNRPTGFLGA